MRIGVNARLLLKGRLEGIGWHAWEIISRLIRRHPEHHFILFYDRHTDILVPDGSNRSVIKLSPQSRHPILIHLWCEYVLSYACRREQIDLFYSPEPLMPGDISVPSIITVHDLTPFRMPETMPWAHRRYYQYILKRNLKQAHQVITVSQFSKQEIISLTRRTEESIAVVYNAARNIFKPFTINQKQSIQDHYTASKPYFIVVGAIQKRKNVDLAIKAFDFFKSTYYQPHKLVIVGKFMGPQPQVNHAIHQSSYKTEIIELGYQDDKDLAALMASATALLNLSSYEGFGMPLVEAFQCSTPVIASNQSCYPEITGDAAILVDSANLSNIVEAMSQFAKDPNPWTEKGKKESKRFDWDQSAQQVSAIIQSFQ